MKRILFLLIVLPHSQMVMGQATMELKLLQLNLNAVVNKPIDSLLNKLPQPNDTTILISSWSSAFQGAILIVSYNNSPYSVSLYPYEIQHITVLNSNKLPAADAWPLHLLRKEKLGKVIIYKDGIILKEFNYTPGTEFRRKN